MLRCYNVYQYDNGPYEEEYENESSDEDDEWDKNRRSCHCNDVLCLSTSPGWQRGQDKDDESDKIMTTVYVCATQPILERELAVVII